MGRMSWGRGEEMGTKETQEEEKKVQSRRGVLESEWVGTMGQASGTMKEEVRCVFPTKIIYFSARNMTKKSEYEYSNRWQQTSYHLTENLRELLQEKSPQFATLLRCLSHRFPVPVWNRCPDCWYLRQETCSSSLWPYSSLIGFLSPFLLMLLKPGACICYFLPRWELLFFC